MLQPRRHGVARTLSKLGVCSRSAAERLVRAGRVQLDGRLVRDPDEPVVGSTAKLEVDGIAVHAAAPVYVMLNKPRGSVVSTADERGRATVHDLLANSGLPWLGAVGRLDKASEGLLLLTNDTVWAAGITAPETHVMKTYHVQVRGLVTADQVATLMAGIDDGGEHLTARAVQVVRQGEHNTWLEFQLDQGRNRQLRRMLAALDFEVLRLVRIAIGDLMLGDLPRGAWRALTATERAALRRSAPRSR